MPTLPSPTSQKIITDFISKYPNIHPVVYDTISSDAALNSFEKYCEEIFPWLEKCLNLCLKKNLCEGYNVRLPAFLAERFTSFWFSQHKNKKNLSYARLGKNLLSNNYREASLKMRPHLK